MAKEIFLTGATGNIGSKIVVELVERKMPFTVGLTTPPATTQHYSYRLLNFADKTSMSKAFEGVSTLFFLLPVLSPMKQFAKNIIAAAKECGVQHLVRSSAAGASPSSPYQLLAVHGQIDLWVQESGLDYTILRPKSFMQNFVNFFSYNIKQGTVYASTGAGKSAWIDTRDIAAVAATILNAPSEYTNQIFTLSGSQSFAMPTALHRIGEVIGKEIYYIEVTQTATNNTLKKMGLSDYVVDMLASIDKGTKDGIMEAISGEVQQILGRPPITFQQFIQDYKKSWL